MDRIPARLNLEYDLTPVLAYGFAALVMCLALGIIVGVAAGYIVSMRRMK